MCELTIEKELISETGNSNFILALALIALLIGLLIYVFVREPIYDIIDFMQKYSGVYQAGNSSILIGSLPTFVHTLAFSLLTALLLPSRKTYFLISVSFWVLINIAFEVLQKAGSESAIVEYITSLSLCQENCSGYFHYGTYDIYDVYSILAGGIFACFVLCITKYREKNELL